MKISQQPHFDPKEIGIYSLSVTVNRMVENALNLTNNVTQSQFQRYIEA